MPDGAGQTFGYSRNFIPEAGAADVGANDLFTLAPEEHFDYPNDFLEGDGIHTIKAWAEDDDGSPVSL